MVFYKLGILWQTACMVAIRILIDKFASLFNCTYGVSVLILNNDYSNAVPLLLLFFAFVIPDNLFCMVVT